MDARREGFIWEQVRIIECRARTRTAEVAPTLDSGDRRVDFLKGKEWSCGLWPVCGKPCTLAPGDVHRSRRFERRAFPRLDATKRLRGRLPI